MPESASTSVDALPLVCRLVKVVSVKSCDLTDTVGLNNLLAVAVSKAAGVSLSSRGWEVSLVLYPSTAEDSVSQFVRLTLTLTLDQQVGLCSLGSQCRWKSLHFSKPEND